MEENEKKDIFEVIWKFLSSVKLAIFVFIILAASSIVGTIVEQQAEPARNIALLAKFFGDSAAPAVYNIFAKLGFMDMYRSWWFISFLVIFCINLIVCSLDRLPKTIRLVRTPQRPLTANAVKSLPIKKEAMFRTGLSKVKDEFMNTLHSSRYRVMESSGDDAVQLYTQKWAFCRLGAYIVHISIILIFIGAIVGARFGFGGYLNLPEGGMSSVAYARQGKEKIPLGFTIKCNWYETRYYEGGDTPLEFSSELVIFENGKEVLKKVIEVNHPLKYKGITFYQSSYGLMPEAVGKFILKITPNGGQNSTRWLGLGDSFTIPDTGIKGTIVDFSPALGRDKYTGALTTYSESMVNPAAAIEFEIPGRDTFTGWILKRYPDTGQLPGGHSVTLEDYWGVEYTGLQVSKDPGVWLIYLASIVMAIGLYICFFISHKKIWVNISHESSKGPVKVSVGGSANRNRLAFEKEIDKILSRASEALGGKTK